MTSDSYPKVKEEELLANLQMRENATLFDRTNIYTTAESILFVAFVGLICDPKGLPGLSAWFPIIVICIGIAFSIHWTLWSSNQIAYIRTVTQNLKSRKERSFSDTYYQSLNAPKSTTKYEVPPILFAVGWILIMIVYCLLATNVIAL